MESLSGSHSSLRTQEIKDVMTYSRYNADYLLQIEFWSPTPDTLLYFLHKIQFWSPTPDTILNSLHKIQFWLPWPNSGSNFLHFVEHTSCSIRWPVPDRRIHDDQPIVLGSESVQQVSLTGQGWEVRVEGCALTIHRWGYDLVVVPALMLLRIDWRGWLSKYKPAFECPRNGVNRTVASVKMNATQHKGYRMFAHKFPHCCFSWSTWIAQHRSNRLTAQMNRKLFTRWKCCDEQHKDLESFTQHKWQTQMSD